MGIKQKSNRGASIKEDTEVTGDKKLIHCGRGEPSTSFKYIMKCLPPKIGRPKDSKCLISWKSGICKND